MGYEIKSLTADDAYTILHWRYAPPYDLYNLTYTEGAVMMLMVGDYYGVYENGSLLGYFCFGRMPVCLAVITAILPILILGSEWRLK